VSASGECAHRTYPALWLMNVVGRAYLIKTKYLQTAYLTGDCALTFMQSQSSDSVMVIKLIRLLSLISIIASTTVVSRSSSQKDCSVWFKRNENGSCECGSELGGVIRCDPHKQVVSIMAGYCMSVDNPRMAKASWRLNAIQDCVRM